MSEMITVCIVMNEETAQRIRVLAAMAAQSRSEWVRAAIDQRLAGIDAVQPEVQPELVA